MSEPVRILLVDDHTLFRESLVRLLESESDFRVVAQCATVSEAVQISNDTPMDIILLDYDLGTEVGTDLVSRLGGKVNDVRVLLVTGGIEPKDILRAVDMGVSGIVLKHSNPRQLIKAIRRVIEGENWWDTGILRSAVSTNHIARGQVRTVRSLTERQSQVLHGILDGLTNKEIATRIQASESAVKASIQELFIKAGVRTRGQLVRIAVEMHSSDWLKDA